MEELWLVILIDQVFEPVAILIVQLMRYLFKNVCSEPIENFVVLYLLKIQEVAFLCTMDRSFEKLVSVFPLEFADCRLLE